MPDVTASESSDAKPSDRRITTFSLSLNTQAQLAILKKQLHLPSKAAVVAALADRAVAQVRLDLSPQEALALQTRRLTGEKDLNAVVWRALKDGGWLVVKADEEVV